MFTGLIEESGVVVARSGDQRSGSLTVQASVVCAGTRTGDSIAVNGCCLTAVDVRSDRLVFDVIPQTFAMTNLGALEPGDRVNLERCLAVGARLGGHFVQGHIDGVGTIRWVRPDENAVIIDIEIPRQLHRYVVPQGSVAVDGVSLTVAGLTDAGFTVWTIPHTREVTTLGARAAGTRVNVECDLVGKYVERLLQTGRQPENPAPELDTSSI